MKPNITRVFLMVAVGVFSCSSCQQENQVTNLGSVTKCCVSFITRPQVICFDEKSVINDLVLRPMKDAKPDLTPASYPAMGQLEIISANGSTENLTLFWPWGRYEHNDEYFVADFSGLKAACEKAEPSLKSLGSATEAKRSNRPVQ